MWDLGTRCLKFSRNLSELNLQLCTLGDAFARGREHPKWFPVYAANPSYHNKRKFWKNTTEKLKFPRSRSEMVHWKSCDLVRCTIGTRASSSANLRVLFYWLKKKCKGKINEWKQTKLLMIMKIRRSLRIWNFVHYLLSLLDHGSSGSLKFLDVH